MISRTDVRCGPQRVSGTECVLSVYSPLSETRSAQMCIDGRRLSRKHNSTGLILLGIEVIGLIQAVFVSNFLTVHPSITNDITVTHPS